MKFQMVIAPDGTIYRLCTETGKAWLLFEGSWTVIGG